MYEVAKIASKYKENIIFTGYIPNDEIAIMYHIANLQVIPSNWGEPLGNVVIEGMASGIRQIVTRDGGITEIAQYSNSIIIEKQNLKENLYEAMINCIEQKDYKRRKTDEEILAKYSEENYSRSIFKIIKE